MDDSFTYDSYGCTIYEYDPRTCTYSKWLALVDFRTGQKRYVLT